jgi:hypothetical protein
MKMGNEEGGGGAGSWFVVMAHGPWGVWPNSQEKIQASRRKRKETGEFELDPGGVPFQEKAKRGAVPCAVCRATGNNPYYIIICSAP